VSFFSKTPAAGGWQDRSQPGQQVHGGHLTDGRRRRRRPRGPAGPGHPVVPAGGCHAARGRAHRRRPLM